MTFHIRDATVRKVTAYLPVSREILVYDGLEEPTPEERAEREKRRQDNEQRANIYRERMDAARDQLAKVSDPLARAVLDLHCEGECGCEGCDFGGYEAEEPDWPCRTVITVGRGLGIDVPEQW